MKLKSTLMRVTALAAVAVALLASCGGGDQIEVFVPNRIVVFGDEQSLIVASTAPEGIKYSVNGVDRDTDGTTLLSTRKCARNPIWVQVLATNYGYQFQQCATTTGATTLAANSMQAQASNTVATMATQISAFSASPGFSSKDLVTVMAGTHDLVAAELAAGDQAAALAAARAAGTALGQQVVNITDRGAKVIVSTLPDVGATPYGVSLGAVRAGLLTDMSASFNSALRIKLQDVRGGGRSAGLVLGDELVFVMRRAPAAHGINGAVPEALSQAACTSLPNCDEFAGPLSAEATTAGNHGNDWLWAGPLQLGPNAQNRLGVAAANRARSNPF
jgi:outer membrane lipase/esterase